MSLYFRLNTKCYHCVTCFFFQRQCIAVYSWELRCSHYGGKMTRHDQIDTNHLLQINKQHTCTTEMKQCGRSGDRCRRKPKWGSRRT